MPNLVTTARRKAVRCIVPFVVLGLCGAGQIAAQGAPATPTPEQIEALRSKNILFLSPDEQLLAYRNLEHVAATREISSGEETYPLRDAANRLDEISLPGDGSPRSMRDIMEELHLTGLLVVRDGEVVVEEYARGNTPQTRWTSFSVAKSVVSLLFGAAIRDGHVDGVDDEVVRYLPALAGSAYDGVTIQQLLQMSSGVAWSEDYTDPSSDVARIQQISETGGIEGLMEYMSGLDRAAPHGSRFNYNTGETHLAGAILREATGLSLAEYLSRSIWRPYGMESDAFWVLLREGDVEHGGCCVSATLRDYGRIGMFVLDDGVTPGGERVLPHGWMQESTRPAATYPGYGYFWWLLPDQRIFASGIFGQHIHIDPAERIVIAMHGIWPQANDRGVSQRRQAFIDAVTQTFDPQGEDP